MAKPKDGIQQRVLVVSADEALCGAARQELEERSRDIHVSAVGSVEAARSVLKRIAPAVILLEEAVVTPEATGATSGVGHGPAQIERLDSEVHSLAAFAPVVVIGTAERQTELAALVAAGVADYVARTMGCLPVALGLVERRLRQFRVEAGERGRGMARDDEDFGEVLRHELNNPLTGILGNAELLLTEIRRSNDGLLPNGGQQRVETIAALAMRLRETVRRLSGEWEARREPARTS